MLIASILAGIVGYFSSNYIHRELGFQRYFLFFAIFYLGILLVSIAGSLDLLIIGWEFVGVSSFFLIGFFWSANNPVNHAITALVSYRFCDVSLILSSVVFMSISNSTKFNHDSLVDIATHPRAGFLIACIVIASLAKASQFPFMGWLPKAMEGPTSSSAIFYGGLSVHLGPLLLLKFSSLLTVYSAASASLIAIGVVSATLAAMMGRARADIKTQLAFAVIAQLGFIYIEIGLGFYDFAFMHCIGHLCLRTFQFLRVPSIIQDYQNLGISHSGFSIESLYPSSIEKKLYWHAVNNFYTDRFGIFVMNALEKISPKKD
jgi:NADH:ubiquinone oxidoreductase subunit 5 (subunit L)/multisubunit Na+/H+ antiporter MnhA subunit